VRVFLSSAKQAVIADGLACSSCRRLSCGAKKAEDVCKELTLNLL
jgi:hypothetical protein